MTKPPEKIYMKWEYYQDTEYIRADLCKKLLSDRSDMTDERIETGALQVDDDWTGLFIRGDDVPSLKFLFLKIIRGDELDDHDKLYCDMWLQVFDGVRHASFTDDNSQRIKTK